MWILDFAVFNDDYPRADTSVRRLLGHEAAIELARV